MIVKKLEQMNIIAKTLIVSLLAVFLQNITFAKTPLFVTKQNISTNSANSKKWWKEAICYEIYIRSFKDSNGNGIGDLNGITEKLDYLQALGIDVIWITPFYPSPGVDMGYDISDYKDVGSKFGTIKDFENLLAEAHKRGIKVTIDMVFAHTSDQHPWFKSARKSKNSIYRDYYIWEKPKKGSKPPNNWQSWFSGSAWQYNKATEDYYLHVFAVQQPALNWKDPNVRKALENVAKFWLEKGVDGLRFDVINLIAMPNIDQPQSMFGQIPKVHEYLKELNKNVLSRYNIFTVGEMGVGYKNAWKYLGPKQKQLETIFQLDVFSLGCKNGNKFSPEPYKLLKFKQVYQNWYDHLYGKGWLSVVLGNHDQGRMVNRWGNTKEYWKYSAKMLATFELTQWGTPYIYQGDEIGMTNCPFIRDEFKDVEAINYYNAQIKAGKKPADFLPGLLARSRDNARTPMQWNKKKNAGFSNAKKAWIKVNPNYNKINVASELKDPDSILNYYKKMIQIRKKYKVFTYGTYKQLDPKNKQIFAYLRTYRNNKFLVVLNFTARKAKFKASVNDMRKQTVLICNYDKYPKIGQGGILDLLPYEAVIYKLSNS